MKRFRVVYTIGAGGAGVAFIAALNQQSALIAFVAANPNVAVTSVTEDVRDPAFHPQEK